MTKNKVKKCPTPHQKPYYKLLDAYYALNKVFQEYSGAVDKVAQVYRCPAGHFHVVKGK